jgi:hypothetical protein
MTTDAGVEAWDYWLRYRLHDLKAQIAAEDAIGRKIGLYHAAKRMVTHLEEQKMSKTDMNLYPCIQCGKGSALKGVGRCPDCRLEAEQKVSEPVSEKVKQEMYATLSQTIPGMGDVVLEEDTSLSDWQKLNNEVTRLTGRVGDIFVELNALKQGSPMIGPLRDTVAKHDKSISELNERLGKLEGNTPVTKDNATSKMLLKRFLAIQRICESHLVAYKKDQQWLAQSVLNILNGNVR